MEDEVGGIPIAVQVPSLGFFRDLEHQPVPEDSLEATRQPEVQGDLRREVLDLDDRVASIPVAVQVLPTLLALDHLEDQPVARDGIHRSIHRIREPDEPSLSGGKIADVLHVVLDTYATHKYSPKPKVGDAQ